MEMDGGNKQTDGGDHEISVQETESWKQDTFLHKSGMKITNQILNLTWLPVRLFCLEKKRLPTYVCGALLKWWQVTISIGERNCFKEQFYNTWNSNEIDILELRITVAYLGHGEKTNYSANPPGRNTNPPGRNSQSARVE